MPVATLRLPRMTDIVPAGWLDFGIIAHVRASQKDARTRTSGIASLLGFCRHAASACNCWTDR